MTEDKPFYCGYWADKNKFRWSLADVQSMVGPGWGKLLKDLTDKLFFLGWGGGIEQVKEKFGTLRFYFTNDCPGMAADIAYDVVEQAELRSSQICEDCGESGKLRGEGWWRTLCSKHAVEQEYAIKPWEAESLKKSGFPMDQVRVADE